MARIRTIKPDFWSDEKIVQLTPLARLLFLGLLNFADDEGRMTYSPKKIKMLVFPGDEVDVPSCLDELLRQNLIRIYERNDRRYLAICNFAKHQKIDRKSPSQIPGPFDDASTGEQNKLDEYSTNHRRAVGESSTTEGKRKGR